MEDINEGNSLGKTNKQKSNRPRRKEKDELLTLRFLFFFLADTCLELRPCSLRHRTLYVQSFLKTHTHTHTPIIPLTRRRHEKTSPLVELLFPSAAATAAIQPPNSSRGTHRVAPPKKKKSSQEPKSSYRVCFFDFLFLLVPIYKNRKYGSAV